MIADKNPCTVSADRTLLINKQNEWGVLRVQNHMKFTKLQLQNASTYQIKYEIYSKGVLVG